MDISAEIRAFLTTRRARITPVQAGLPDYGGRRRVPGLRREEVALLAGMSAEYYIRFERGNARGISPSIIEGVSRALQLDTSERAHLFDLVRAASEDGRPRRHVAPPPQAEVSRTTQQLLDAMTGVPAVVQNGRLDVVGSNALARALFADMWNQHRRPANFARFLFLDERSLKFWQDWDDSAAQLVSLLRAELGRTPEDSELTSTIEELRAGSETFRSLWATHDVNEHSTGVKRIRHSVVGDIELDYEAMQLVGDTNLYLIAWSAPASTPSADALVLLGALAASAPSTHDRRS